MIMLMISLYFRMKKTGIDDNISSYFGREFLAAQTESSCRFFVRVIAMTNWRVKLFDNRKAKQSVGE
ncbi:MAG: hypothetical protein C4548_05620 [Desulfobacteraceae bacterium]|nr:MAG: hypothetical protein C4548_05620 [Desulfobacteraceae bacterium]